MLQLAVRSSCATAACPLWAATYSGVSPPRRPLLTSTPAHASSCLPAHTGGGSADKVIGGAVFKVHCHAPGQRKRTAPGADVPPLVVLDVLVLVVRALCAPAVRMHAALPAGACARAGQVAQDEGKCGQGYGTRLVNGLKVPS